MKIRQTDRHTHTHSLSHGFYLCISITTLEILKQKVNVSIQGSRAGMEWMGAIPANMLPCETGRDNATWGVNIYQNKTYSRGKDFYITIYCLACVDTVTEPNQVIVNS